MEEVNGTAEVGTTPEVVEAAPVVDSNEYQITLEELMTADFGDDPIMSTTHRGLKPYNEILQHLPEDARKLVSNLRAMSTQKTQEVADQRRALDTERANLIKERELLLGGGFQKQINELASKPIEHDAWSEEGMQQRIQQEAAKMFQQMLNPLQMELEQAKQIGRAHV